MSAESLAYIRRLLQGNQKPVEGSEEPLLATFAHAPAQEEAYLQISKLQEKIMADWAEKNRIQAVLDKLVQLPNGRVGVNYEYIFDLGSLGLGMLSWFSIEVPESSGLAYDEATNKLTGTPIHPGDTTLTMRFKHSQSPADGPVYEKLLKFYINADPRTLWVEKPSDREDPYHQPDTAILQTQLVSRTVVAASKRGRSHAQEGIFRDDNFLVAEVGTGWGLLAVADGAGSARFSRKGSLIACQTLQSYFSETVTAEEWQAIDGLLAMQNSEEGKEAQKSAYTWLQKHVGKAAFEAAKAIDAEAKRKLADEPDSKAKLKDYSTTLLFVLIKQFEAGYCLASFWVGDGAIALYRTDPLEVDVLGTPDGGEFAGQTRFVTMPEIFSDTVAFYSRIKIKMNADFKALFVMSDGITDPKFATDANLLRVEHWTKLWDDLQGNNETKTGLAFDGNDENQDKQLLAWLDFLSPGNHDDRTIVILY